MERQNIMKKQKTMFRIAAAGLLGAVLLAAWLVTGERGLSESNLQIYEQAQALQEQVDALGFRNFRIADYPVAVFDGKRDHVIYQGEIRERAPVLETFAGTAYPVEDHFEVIIPTVEQFDRLLALAGGVESMIEGSGYGPKEQQAVLWHEAFHAYQLTHYAILGEKITPEDMRVDLENAEVKEGISEEEWIVREVDRKEEIHRKQEAELKLLERAAKLASRMKNEDWRSETNTEKLGEMLSQYGGSRRQRLAEMSREAAEAEIRCELTEGTAYYVEANVYRMLNGADMYEEKYLDGIGVYEDGRGKYYRTGMAKCLILDVLVPGWKETFDFSHGLDALM